MIPHNRPTIGEPEAAAAAQVINSGYLVGGEQTRQFENDMCDFLGLPAGHALCVTSGSSALYIALKVLALAHKTVAMPGYVCSSLQHACALNQSKPLYLDNQAGLPIPQFDGQSFDGLIYPYLYGLSSYLPSQPKPVIEDLAQALGAKVDGQMLGTMGTVGVLSFYATKLMTSGGQGGMLVSTDASLIAAARDYIEFDQRQDNFARFNFHITEMQAAIGRVQLQRLPEFIEQRQQRWQIYRDAGLPLLDIVDTADNSLSHVRYRAVVTCQQPQRLIDVLKAQDVSAINPFDVSELLSTDCPNALALCQQTVSLPLYPTLGIDDCKRIADIAAEVITTP
ncbi:MAG: perosamine synthetase [Phenylobacterium sp.]|jgi:perosamine synthetase